MNNSKIGYLAPKGYRWNEFQCIKLPNNLGYCSSHNFVFNYEEERVKLYNGDPCIYTDSRYKISEEVYNARRKGSKFVRTLKSLFRIVEKIRNLPVGIIIKFTNNWYFADKNFTIAYNYKVKSSKLFNPNYEVNDLQYLDNLSDSELALALSEKGFLIRTEYDGYIDYSKSEREYNKDVKYYFAYGYGKIAIFANEDIENLGCRGSKYVMWDKVGCFDKFSKCNTINKELGLDYIINLLTTPNDLLPEESINWTQYLR